MNWGTAWAIFKQITSEDISLKDKVDAIQIVAHMETLNSITKEDLRTCLRFVADTFDMSAALEDQEEEQAFAITGEGRFKALGYSLDRRIEGMVICNDNLGAAICINKEGLVGKYCGGVRAQLTADETVAAAQIIMEMREADGKDGSGVPEAGKETERKDV